MTDPNEDPCEACSAVDKEIEAVLDELTDKQIAAVEYNTLMQVLGGVSMIGGLAKGAGQTEAAEAAKTIGMQLMVDMNELAETHFGGTCQAHEEESCPDTEPCPETTRNTESN